MGKVDTTSPAGALGKSQTASDLLMKLARTSPYYKRNRPHICSFWVKGECKRGEECPYRHEKPTDPDDPLADQNIKDRLVFAYSYKVDLSQRNRRPGSCLTDYRRMNTPSFRLYLNGCTSLHSQLLEMSPFKNLLFFSRYYGMNDPVAEKLLRRADQMPKLEPPEDKTITTLYIGNLGEKMGEKELRDHFYQYGEIRAITIISRQQCAFIQYTQRAAAEAAAERTFNKLILGGRRLTIKWGRSQGRQGGLDEMSESKEHLEPVPGLPGALPPPPAEMQNNFFNLPPSDMGIIPPPPMPPMMLPPPASGVCPPGPPPMMHPPGGAPGTSAPYFFPTLMRPPPGVRPPHPPPLFPPGTAPIFPRMAPNPTPPSAAAAAAAAALVPPGTTTIHYPSQDPSRMGTAQVVSKD